MVSEAEIEAVINARFSEPVYKTLKGASVGVAGLGGLGSHIAVALARCGIGRLVIADFDTVELTNINRQFYNLSHMGRRKTDVMKEEISKINPYVCVEVSDCVICESNAGAVFKSCDVVIEAFDKPESKAELVNALLSQTQTTVVASSGMAGFYDGNEIVTKKISNRFYLCGDGKHGIENGTGLTAPRVMICAGHCALAAVRIMLTK